ncbi:uncharacterized protein METZ01_LOCUS396774, partial [marine metagenome]
RPPDCTHPPFNAMTDAWYGLTTGRPGISAPPASTIWVLRGYIQYHDVTRAAIIGLVNWIQRSFNIFLHRRAGLVLAGVCLLLIVGAKVTAARIPLIVPAAQPLLMLVALSDTEIDSETKTGRYSLLVRQIQLRLAELGLYGGRIGGVMSAETAEAIRTYQRFANLPVDGKPSHELLDNLTSAAGEAQHLLLRLDRSQADQIEKARSVLEQAFGPDWAIEARAVVVDAVPDLQALKARAEHCYGAPEPACLIVEAEVAAESVEKDNLRDWALSDIISAQARIGQSEE